MADNGIVALHNTTSLVFSYYSAPSSWGFSQSDISTGSVESNEWEDVQLKGDCYSWTFRCNANEISYSLSTGAVGGDTITIVKNNNLYEFVKN